MSYLSLSVFHCTAGLRHHMQDCIYFLTSNDVNLPVERCRRVVSPRPEHGCHSNPPPLSCDVLPGLCGRPGVGIRTSRAPCQTDKSTLSDNVLHASQEKLMSSAENCFITTCFPFAPEVSVFWSLTYTWLTCDINVIVQGDHGVSPLVRVGEIRELVPLFCREKQKKKGSGCLSIIPRVRETR